MKRSCSAVAVGLLMLCSASASAVLELDSDIYRNHRLGVKLTVPEGWTLSRQTGYPAILAILTHADSSARINLAAVQSPTTPAQLERIVRDNAKAMRAIGIRVEAQGTVRDGRDRWQIIGNVAAGRRSVPHEIHQTYLPGKGEHVFIVTLTCTPRERDARLGDRNYVLDTLELTPPATAPPPEEEQSVVEERPSRGSPPPPPRKPPPSER